MKTLALWIRNVLGRVCGRHQCNYDDDYYGDRHCVCEPAEVK